MRQMPLVIVAAMVLVSSCGHKDFEGEIQYAIGPIEIAVTSSGDVHGSLGWRWVTPLGEFAVKGGVTQGLQDRLPNDGKDGLTVLIRQSFGAEQRDQGFFIKHGQKLRMTTNGKTVQEFQPHQVLIEAAPGTSVIVRLETPARQASTDTAADTNAQKPTVISPTDGQTLRYSGTYAFNVSPVDGATGYLWGFFQDGQMVWENYRDERKLSGTEYRIQPGSPAHGRFHAGEVQVWVRAMVNGRWTDATIITIDLR